MSKVADDPPAARGASPPTACVDADLLLELIQGNLATAAARGAAAHVEDCPICQRVIAELARTSLLATSDGATDPQLPRGGSDTSAGPRAPSPRPAASTVGPGTALGRYRILDTVGSGAMGVVYAAYDPQLDRSRQEKSSI